MWKFFAGFALGLFVVAVLARRREAAWVTVLPQSELAEDWTAVSERMWEEEG